MDFKALIHEARLDGVAFPDEDAPLDWIPFPVEELPATVRDYALAHAHAIGCDPALVAMPCLAAVAAGIGNAACIALDHTWKEPPTLWTSVVAPSGSAKSPAQNVALRPTMDLEREAAVQYRLEREAYDEALAEQRAKQKGKEPLFSVKPPKRMRYRVGDVTAESLLVVHADNPRGLFLVRDELAGWLSGFDRYAKSGKGDAQTWIEMYGALPVAVDRKSNADSPVLYVDRPSVSIAGGIQPGVLARTLRGEHFDSGFAARLLMAWPPARTLEWRPTSHGAVEEVNQAFQHTVRGLYALPFRMDGARVTPVEIPLSPRAVEAFQRFHRVTSSKTGRLPEMAPLRSVWSKAPALCARLALCIELAERVSEAPVGSLSLSSETTIGAASVERAARLTRWFLREVLRIYRRLELGGKGASAEDAKVRRLPETFTRDDVQRVWALQDPSSASKKLKGLVHAGKVAKQSHGVYRRPPDSDELTGSLSDLELIADLPPLPSEFLPRSAGDGLAQDPPDLLQSPL